MVYQYRRSPPGSDARLTDAFGVGRRYPYTMGLRCLLGHEYANREVEREREERGNEVVVTYRTVETCDRCGERFERYPSHIGDNVFCGEPCRRAWLSEAFTGDGHPNWKGGGNEEYGKGWRAVRQRALERDNYSCRVCGQSREELGRNPDVHHIRPVRSFIESENHTREDAHYIENVISLCISCHRKAEFEKIDAEHLRSLIADS